jgi:hypothetical protein
LLVAEPALVPSRAHLLLFTEPLQVLQCDVHPRRFRRDRSWMWGFGGHEPIISVLGGKFRPASTVARTPLHTRKVDPARQRALGSRFASPHTVRSSLDHPLQCSARFGSVFRCARSEYHRLTAYFIKCRQIPFPQVGRSHNPLVAGSSPARPTLNLLRAGGGDRVGKPVRNQPVGDRNQASHTQSPPRRAWLQTTPSWPTFNKLGSSESWVQGPPCAVILFGNAVKHIATLFEKLLRSRRNLSRS